MTLDLLNGLLIISLVTLSSCVVCPMLYWAILFEGGKIEPETQTD